MPLVPCKECNSNIHHKARVCPQCGVMIHDKTSIWILPVYLALMIASAVVYLRYNQTDGLALMLAGTLTLILLLIRSLL